MFIKITIEEKTLLNLFVKEIQKRTQNKKVIELYTQLYSNLIIGGGFNNIDFDDIPEIVEADYENSIIIDKYNQDYKKIKSYILEGDIGLSVGLSAILGDKYSGYDVITWTADYELFLIGSILRYY